MQITMRRTHHRPALLKWVFLLLIVQSVNSYAGTHDNLVRSLFPNWAEQVKTQALSVTALQLLQDFTPQSQQDEAQLAFIKAMHSCHTADPNQCRAASSNALNQPLHRLQKNALRLAMINSYVIQKDADAAWASILRYQEDNQPLSTQDAIQLTEFMLRLDDAQKAATWRAQIPKDHPYISWIALKLQAAPLDEIWSVTQANTKASAWQKAYVLYVIAQEQGDLLHLNEAYQAQMHNNETAPSWSKIIWEAWRNLQFKIADLTISQNKWLIGEEPAWLDAADSWPAERYVHAQAIRYFVWHKHTDSQLKNRAQQAWLDTFAAPEHWSKAWIEEHQDEIVPMQQQHLGLRLLTQAPSTAAALLRRNPVALDRAQALLFAQGALQNQDTSSAWGALLQTYNQTPQWSVQELEQVSPTVLQLLRLPSSISNQMLAPLIENLQQNNTSAYKQSLNLAFAQRLLLQGDAVAASRFFSYAVQAGGGSQATQLYEQAMQAANLSPVTLIKQPLPTSSTQTRVDKPLIKSKERKK